MVLDSAVDLTPIIVSLPLRQPEQIRDLVSCWPYTGQCISTTEAARTDPWPGQLSALHGSLYLYHWGSQNRSVTWSAVGLTRVTVSLFTDTARTDPWPGQLLALHGSLYLYHWGSQNRSVTWSAVGLTRVTVSLPLRQPEQIRDLVSCWPYTGHCISTTEAARTDPWPGQLSALHGSMYLYHWGSQNRSVTWSAVGLTRVTVSLPLRQPEQIRDLVSCRPYTGQCISTTEAARTDPWPGQLLALHGSLYLCSQTQPEQIRDLVSCWPYTVIAFRNRVCH